MFRATCFAEPSAFLSLKQLSFHVYLVTTGTQSLSACLLLALLDCFTHYTYYPGPLESTLSTRVDAVYQSSVSMPGYYNLKGEQAKDDRDN